MEIAKQRTHHHDKDNVRRVRKNSRGLIDLEKEEISGSYYENHSSSYSDTDDDENEGLGDGKIGRDRHDLFDK